MTLFYFASLSFLPKISFIICPLLSKYQSCSEREKKGLLIHMPIAKGSLTCSPFVCKNMGYSHFQTFALMCGRYSGKSFGVVSDCLWCRTQKTFYDCVMKIWAIAYDWGCWGQRLKACIHSVPKWLPGSPVKTQLLPKGHRKEQNVPSHLRRRIFDGKFISFEELE